MSEAEQICLICGTLIAEYTPDPQQAPPALIILIIVMTLLFFIYPDTPLPIYIEDEDE